MSTVTGKTRPVSYTLLDKSKLSELLPQNFAKETGGSHQNL